MSTVRARVTVSSTSILELPVVSKRLLEMAPSEFAYELWGMNVKEDGEVGVMVSDVPVGVPVRKPFGKQEYLRAYDEPLRRVMGLKEERVLMIADGYSISLMEGHQIVVAKLSDLYGCQWDLVDEELHDLHCPQ